MVVLAHIPTTLLRAFAILTIGSLFTAGPALASGGIDPADPMVKITAPANGLNGPEIMAKVSRDVAEATGVEERFVTYYWQTFDAIHCMGEPSPDKPIFVDMYVPGFFTDEDVASMMTAIADSLETHSGIDKKWVFIQTHFPQQGHVYISGHVEHWDNYRGKGDANPRDISERAPEKFRFNDRSFAFQCLWRFGIAAAGGSDLGELITITSQVDDFDVESWYAAWNSMARKVRAMAESFAKKGHAISARDCFFRATTYFRASEIYLEQDDPRRHNAWLDGRKCFLRAAELSQGRIEHVRIPYEGTTLPGYLVTPDSSDAKRPLLLIQTGLDGTAEDLYFIMGVQAAKRGYTCLIFEGPGQGEMISEQNLPFRHDWENVVTPVVDFALTLQGVDPQRIALLGYSMGGYLAPRALAHEKRIRWGIANGGVHSVFQGVMSKFPEAVQEAVRSGACTDQVNDLAYQQMDKHSDLRQFINQMLWTFQAETPCQLFDSLKRYTIADSIETIEAEMLVVNSSNDQIAGSNAQAKRFYEELPGTKTYLEFTADHGAQFHCQVGAPTYSSERILNWLDERAHP